MYLIKDDYKSYIQSDALRQLTQGDDSKRLQAELKAMQQIVQKLTQRYDLNTELRDTEPWSSTKAYKAGERATVAIGVDGFSAWAANTEYVTGDAVIYNRTGYYCITGNHDATFTPANWKSVGAENSIYHVVWPATCTLRGQPNPATLINPYAPQFDYRNLYDKDDVVWWADNTYVCKQASILISHQTALQFRTETNQPIANVFPNDPVLNAQGQYWGDATVYVIEPGTLLTDTDAWLKADNRNQSVKNWMVALSVYHMAALIAVNNRPQVWDDTAEKIYCDMQAAADGKMTMILPPKYTRSEGLRTRFGGEVKNKNYY